MHQSGSLCISAQWLVNACWQRSHSFSDSLAIIHAGVALRPGFIHGVRRWGTVSVPLNAVGGPLERALSMLPTESLATIPIAGAAFVPPVSVQKVAKAAVSAATDPGVPAGVMDVWTISKV